MSRIADSYVKLSCTICKNVNYRVKKNKKQHKEKMELAKFCPYCRKHTPHKEGK